MFFFFCTNLRWLPLQSERFQRVIEDKKKKNINVRKRTSGLNQNSFFFIRRVGYNNAG